MTIIRAVETWHLISIGETRQLHTYLVESNSLLGGHRLHLLLLLR